ncbi:MAG: AMP-binding protein [Limnochordales bacterium]|nr:AMP-binding protein [Limnochordales bacterium]
MSTLVANVADIVKASAQRDGGRRALVFEGQSWTYAQLDAAIDGFAAALEALRLPRPSVVSVYTESVPELLVAYLGTARAGHVANIVNGTLQAPEVAYILADSDTRVLVTDGSRWRQLAGRPDLPDALERVLVAPAAGDGPWPARWSRPRTDTFASFLAASGSGTPGRSWPVPSAGSSPGATAEARASGPAHWPADPDALSTLMYTSGTTGKPKGVMLSHRNIVDNAVRFAAIHYSPDDRLAIGAPLFHCWGLINGALAILWAGGTALILRRFQTEAALELVRREQATQFLGVAAMYRFMLRAPGSRAALASLKVAHSAAAPTPVELIDRLRTDFGIQYAESYGLTETSPVITTAHWRETRPGSCGKAVGDTELKVVAPGGTPVGPGEAGELWARGTAIMLGYWRRPDATAQAITPDGWFKTGDIVRMDGDGYVYIVDRVKDMINVAGEKVYPREVEEVLHAHPALADAAVVGVPHPDKGEVPKAYVVPKPGAAVSADEIQAYCRERLARFKVPAEVEFVAEIPRSASGKTLRRKLRAAGGTEGSEDQPHPPAHELQAAAPWPAPPEGQLEPAARTEGR